MKTNPSISLHLPRCLSCAALACLLPVLLVCHPVRAAGKPQLGSYVHATLQQVNVTLAHTGGSVPTMSWDGATITVSNGAAVAKLNLQAPELITGILYRDTQVAMPYGYKIGYAGPPGAENAPIRAMMSSLAVPGDPFETYTEIFFGYEAGQATDYKSPYDFPSKLEEDQIDVIRTSAYDASTGILTVNATADFLGYDPTPGIGMFLATATIQIRYALVEMLSMEIIATGEDVEVSSEDGSFATFIMPNSNIGYAPVRIEGNARIVTGIESEADVRFLSGPNSTEQHIAAWFILPELSDVTINELKRASSEDSIRARLWLKAGEINAEVNRYQGGPRSDFSVKTPIATIGVRGTALKVTHSVALNKSTCVVFEGGPVDVQGQTPELAGMLMRGDSAVITPTTLTGSFFETVHPRAQGYKAEFFAHADTPAGIALEPDGDLLVLDDTSGNLTRITPAGSATAYFTAAVPTSGWFGPLLRADGTAVAGHGADGKVYQISTSGVRTLFATIPDPISGIALKADGNLVTTSTTGKLHQISTGGVVTELLTGLVDPSHPAIGADGLVYLAEGNPKRLACINGAAVQNVASIASAPQMLAQVPGFGLVLGQGEPKSFDASSLSTVNTATGATALFADQFSFISGVAGNTTLYYVADPVENSITKITPLPLSTPALSIGTSVLDFGRITATTTSAPKPVTLTNSGTGNLSITGISSTFAVFSPAHAALPIVLAPGASAVVLVSYTPTGTTRTKATLDVVSNDPADATRQVRLDGTGTLPEITMAEPPLRLAGELVTLSVTDGSGGAGLLQVFVGAQEITDFTYIEDVDGMGSIVMRLPPGIPAGTTSVSLMINGVTGSAVDYEVGPAAGSRLSFETLGPIVYFKPVVLAGTSTALIPIRNRGNATLNVTAHSTNHSAFTVVSPAAPFNLTAGATGVIQVLFSPSATGTTTALLSVASNDPIDPVARIELSARLLSYDPTDFWRTSYFPTNPNNPLVAGHLADGDDDGMTNLEERAFSSNPNNGMAAAEAPLSVRFEGDGTAVCTVRVNYLAEDIVVRLMQSSGFSSWTEIASYHPRGGFVERAASSQIVPAGSSIIGDTAIFSESIWHPDGAAGEGFFRLQVDTLAVDP